MRVATRGRIHEGTRPHRLHQSQRNRLQPRGRPYTGHCGAMPCRAMNALYKTTRPVADGEGLRKAGRGNPSPHRCPQPLHRSWHTRHRASRLSPSGERGSPPINRFVHVWMPPLVQEISERFECVIGCGHVSGLSLQRLIQPRAGMAMREPKADQQIELIGSCTKTAFSGPDLSDHFPLLLINLLTRSSPGF